MIKKRPAEKKAASILIQRAYRCWRQRKAYKDLYEKRKWTLHKEGQVLTNHVSFFYFLFLISKTIYSFLLFLLGYKK